jgi:hypothetical protein
MLASNLSGTKGVRGTKGEHLENLPPVGAWSCGWLSHLFKLVVCRNMVQKNLKEKVKNVISCPTLTCTTPVLECWVSVIDKKDICLG